MEKKTKLIRKTSKTFLLTGLVLAILSSIALYFYTKNLLQKEVEEELYSTEARVEASLNLNKQVFSLPPVAEVKTVEDLKPTVLKDTVIYDPSQDEMELFRELSTYKNINNVYYHITVRTLVVESEDILLAIVFSNIAIFVIAFIFLFYFNTARNLQLWKPFFDNLEQMKTFSLASEEPIDLADSDILEFSELKTQILLLTNKVRTDYQNLKQFTENVSHEIQTPLAIIQAKIDNIINEHAINDKQFEQITSIQQDIQRLKQLNKRITTLTKIDNNQFVNVEEVNITNLINEKIEGFKELEIRHILHTSNAQLVTMMDPFLTDILINNLISNAIKYTKNNENIEIVTTSNVLTVTNSGEHPLDNPEKIFLRLYREGNNAQSSGLGLAIVKKICEFYGFTPTYRFQPSIINGQGAHIFQIDFNK
ncbi:HAMP domain-containing histidine kinase [Subsaxibacter sp. CAU 1640]|uniref:sensor histidine kinase n=1 Tax=Subsaxibacter sp. CAU 1640 TaxID=2933271 RepID=UPI002003638E|nr:HAMP domain-containing sensor histidine kinase [Subsaxibacter sp. CAU 1640]MCK7591346.1 HAMP domain-containing histidine kinase [Subsaxibacter sp. CAU 1640]